MTPLVKTAKNIVMAMLEVAGMPAVPDGAPAMPRGIAIKYHLPGGTDTDMVTNSFKFFPVGTGEDFRGLLQAIASPADAPKPTKPEQFFASHPNAPKAIGSRLRRLVREAQPVDQVIEGESHESNRYRHETTEA